MFNSKDIAAYVKSGGDARKLMESRKQRLDENARRQRGATLTNAEMVSLYADTLNGQLNGWGQSLVKAPGTPFDGKQSHYLLYALKQRMGWNAADAAIEAELKARKEKQ